MTTNYIPFNIGTIKTRGERRKNAVHRDDGIDASKAIN